ncbi:MAG: hypothetical protein ACYTHJ_03330 [Planctomycetota bacterium]|jgi:hypothetical protein
MKHQMSNSMSPLTSVMGMLVLVLSSGCRASGAVIEVAPDQRARLEAMQEKGTEASLTVFPVVMGDGTFEDVADVVALLLEQAGMTNLERSNAVFRVPNDATAQQGAALFGAFVHGQPLETEYALYAEFVGAPGKGVKEIRGIIVDRAGRAVLVDHQSAADRSFRRAEPDCPMSSSVFLVERVRTQLGIPASARDESGTGKFARLFADRSPGPDKAEWAAIERRQTSMKQRGRNAKVAIYPVRLSDEEVGFDDATHLSDLLAKSRLVDAAPVDSPLRVKIEPARNEQKLLWQLARAFQNHVRRNPPDADYALLADYIMRPDKSRAWAVHFVICDRAGEWVIVDFQNDHHGDFQSIDPRTADDCGQLVVRRLEGYLD